MKRITLAMMLVAVATTVQAQIPPEPPRPAQPVQPAQPAPRVSPAPFARPALPPSELAEMRMHLNEIDRVDIEASRLAFEDMRRAQEMTLEHSRLAIEGMRDMAPLARLESFAPMAMPPMPAMAPMAEMALPLYSGRSSDGFSRPAPQWFQGDPADSAYRYAQDILNRGDYGRAAQLFRDIAQKYPKSSYQNDLPYYEAYARYKIGTTDELHAAVKLLEARASSRIGTTPATTTTVSGTPRAETFYYGKRGSSDNDVVSLYIRVNSVLAQRGDRAAADIVAKAAQAGLNTCDREEMGIRIEALSALSQMDAGGALPQIKNVLEKKDECSAELRRRAVFMLGRRGDGEAATLLAATAKADPSVSVRADAISWLPKLQGDAGVAALEDLLRTEQDENIQRSVVRTLVSSDNAKARTSMRALIDRKDAPLNLRVEAINSFNNSDRVTPDDVNYLKGLYTRADNDRVKEAIIGALARIGGAENDQWILAIVKNQNESSQLRSSAIARLMRSSMTVADLGKLYDAAESRNIRQQIVSQLDRRTEPDAADKLFDIAKNSTDQSVKSQAFNALLRRKDDRTKQLLNEILEGKKP